MESWTPDFSWITPDLAVGGAFPAGGARRLADECGLGAVIDLRAEARDDPAELEICGLRFLHLPTEDMLGVSQEMLDEGVAFAQTVADDGRKLLVHCRHGIGRSATLALCILVDRGLAPLDAITVAKRARGLVSPSPAQFEAWSGWMARRAPSAVRPSLHEFGMIAYQPAGA